MNVSVVVPVLNGERTIEKCIKSLLDQDYAEELFEIVVVDNGSTDKTLEILKMHRNRIRVFQEKERGSYNARNLGIQNAKGNVVLFTDSDCYVHVNWIDNLTAAFNNPAVKIVGGPVRAYRKDKPLLRYCDLFMHTQEEYVGCRTFATANMGIRKEILDECGGFSPELLSGGDFELCSRAVQDEQELAIINDAIVYHDYRNSLINFLKKYFIYGKYNTIIRTSHGKKFYVNNMSRLNVLVVHGSTFFIFRLLQDIAFHSGRIWGWLKR